jgi:hypothetical protein
MNTFKIFEDTLGALGIPFNILREETNEFFSQKDYSVLHPHTDKDVLVSFSIDTQDQMLLEVHNEDGSVYEECVAFEDEDDVISLVHSI